MDGLKKLKLKILRYDQNVLTDVKSVHAECSRHQTIRADMCRSQAQTHQSIHHLQRPARMICLLPDEFRNLILSRP